MPCPPRGRQSSAERRCPIPHPATAAWWASVAQVRAGQGAGAVQAAAAPPPGCWCSPEMATRPRRGWLHPVAAAWEAAAAAAACGGYAAELPWASALPRPLSRHRRLHPPSGLFPGSAAPLWRHPADRMRPLRHLQPAPRHRAARWRASALAAVAAAAWRGRRGGRMQRWTTAACASAALPWKDTCLRGVVVNGGVLGGEGVAHWERRRREGARRGRAGTWVLARVMQSAPHPGGS